MLSKLRTILLGPDTGKREMGIAVFLAYCMAWIFCPEDRQLVREMVIPVLMFLASVYGMEWVGAQSPWRSNDHTSHFP